MRVTLVSFWTSEVISFKSSSIILLHKDSPHTHFTLRLFCYYTASGYVFFFVFDIIKAIRESPSSLFTVWLVKYDKRSAWIMQWPYWAYLLWHFHPRTQLKSFLYYREFKREDSNNVICLMMEGEDDKEIQANIREIKWWCKWETTNTLEGSSAQTTVTATTSMF